MTPHDELRRPLQTPAATGHQCPPNDFCNPPLHNLLVCCGPKTDPRCPREQWQASHDIDQGEAHD